VAAAARFPTAAGGLLSFSGAAPASALAMFSRPLVSVGFRLLLPI